MKHTKVPLTVSGIYGMIREAYEPYRDTMSMVTSEFDEGTTEANAELIIEAFDVATETGMTPRELVVKLSELKSFVKAVATQPDVWVKDWQHEARMILADLEGIPDSES